MSIPKNPADKRVRTARVDLNYRAVLFAVAEKPEPMWLLAAIQTHDDGGVRADAVGAAVAAGFDVDVLEQRARRPRDRRRVDPGRGARDEAVRVDAQNLGDIGATRDRV